MLAALAAGKLKLATLPTLVVTLSNTYGAPQATPVAAPEGVKPCCARALRRRLRPLAVRQRSPTRLPLPASPLPPPPRQV